MRRSWLLRPATAFAAAGASFAGAAGPATPPPAPPSGLQVEQEAPSDEAIVVTAVRQPQEAVLSFADAVSVETGNQLARFDAPVCPAAFGLKPEQNRLVAERLRRVADHAGLRVDAEGCRPNIAVIVANGTDGFIDALRDERPALFLGMEAAQLRAIREAAGPVRAWQVIEPRGSDGRPLEPISYLQVGGRLVYVGKARLLKEAPASRLQEPTRQDLTLSFVVFDLAALDGPTLTQIADYAAIRAFARTTAPAGEATPTILRLFENAADAPDPLSVTAWDVAYLRALYRPSAGLSFSRQRGAIARIMAEDIARRSAGDDPAHTAR